MTKYCSNKECNPLAPLLTVVKLKRVQTLDFKTGKCPKCKARFDIEVMTDGNHTDVQQGDVCSKCKVQLQPQEQFYLECPKCGRTY
jgi:Zn-finger nucleic acid-binding protein